MRTRALGVAARPSLGGRLAVLFAILLATLLEGCGGRRDAPAVLTFEHDGLSRAYVEHVPEDLVGGEPLLLMLHGGFGNAEKTAGYAGFDVLADEEGFAVAWPGALEAHWNDGREGHRLAENAAGVDDVGFLEALVDALVEEHGLDPDRVYVTGASNGGIMTNRLGCESDRFAAIAPVIGALAAPLADTCAPARPLPVWTLNGSDDTLVTLEGGEVGNGLGETLPVADTVARWVENAGCEGEPETETLDAVDDDTLVERSRWRECAAGVEVEQHLVVGGGHVWPGSRDTILDPVTGTKSEELDAAVEIWRFVSRFSRR